MHFLPMADQVNNFSLKTSFDVLQVKLTFSLTSRIVLYEFDENESVKFLLSLSIKNRFGHLLQTKV